MPPPVNVSSSHPPNCRTRVISSLALVFLPALFLIGCGERGEIPPPAAAPRPVRLILDFLPNPIHIGFYQAMAGGAYAEAGLDPAIHTPSSTSDTLRLMAAGQADFGLVSLADFLNARRLGEPVKIIMAVEQRPLAALLTLEKAGITRPAGLEGKLTGVTGVISDELCLRSMVAYDGGDPDKVRTVTVGYNVTQSLLAGQVDAAAGFWSYEGVLLQARQPARIFKLMDYGAPPYPEIVLFTREETLQTRPGMVRAFLAATARGYEEALAGPEGALNHFVRQVEGSELEQSRLFFDALRNVFIADAPFYGHINLAALKQYLVWAKNAGILATGESPADFATNTYLPQ